MIKTAFTCMLCLSCSLSGGGVSSTAIADEASNTFDSITFLSPWVPSGKVTLSHGEYREPSATGSASVTVVKLTGRKAFGPINGRETGAVVLVTDTGGSGVFYDLALIVKEAEGWVNTDTAFLGDRVKIYSMGIKNDTILLIMKTHSSADPMCCPTLEMKKQFAVWGNRLVPVAVENTAEVLQITGTIWQWVQTLYNDDKKAVPADPKVYTLQFLKDGTLNIKADCNLKGGSYSIGENQISIRITHSTMAACREDSLEDEFTRALSSAVIYFIRDNDLYIDMKYDSGTLKFSKQ